VAGGGWSPQKLTAHLQTIEADEVVLTFAQIDAVVGRLPESARKHNAWWANSVEAHAHARGWLDAGFQATPQFVQGCVWFHRGVPKSGARTRAGGAVKATTVRTPELEPTGEEYQGEVDYSWLAAGEFTLTPSGLVVPQFGVTPGVYRFTLVEPEGEVRSYYIGESENLFQRMNGYRSPGPTQTTNQRINRKLRELLADGGAVLVSVVLEAALDSVPLDLSGKSARLVVENTALLHLAAQGAVIENLRTGS
jgi:hypothetical protein